MKLSVKGDMLISHLKYLTLVFLLFFICETLGAHKNSITKKQSSQLNSKQQTTKLNQQLTMSENPAHHIKPITNFSISFCISHLLPLTQLFTSQYDLIKAVLKSDLKRVQSLVKSGANIDLQDRYIVFNSNRKSYWTPLMYAVDKGDLEITRFLIESGANTHLMNQNGWTPLMLAVVSLYSHIEIIRLLLASGIDVNFKNQDGWTALMYAAYKGHLGIIRFLISSSDIDINIRNRDGWTTLMIAIFYKRLEVAYFLKEIGAKLTSKNQIAVENALK